MKEARRGLEDQGEQSVGWTEGGEGARKGKAMDECNNGAAQQLLAITHNVCLLAAVPP